jgi:EAL domain-containing protein (putative c-di-GMP-specific phosphodiesterase class I)
VEMEAQRQFLARHGCHAYQGYLFSKPLPLDAFEAWAQRGMNTF